MSRRARKKLLRRIPFRLQKLLKRYAKGNFHTPPDLSGISQVDRERLLRDAQEQRLNRCWRILMERGGVVRAVRWPEYEEVIARIRARDESTISPKVSLTAIEREYVTGERSSIGIHDLRQSTPERAQFVAVRRARCIRASLERGERIELNHPDVRMHLLPLVHPSKLVRAQKTLCRIHHLPNFDPHGTTKRDRYLRTKHARHLTALRRCWSGIFAHPRTFQLFTECLHQQICANRRFAARTA